MSIIVADRRPIFLSGLVAILSTESDFAVVASCSDIMGCARAIRELAPELALLDIGLGSPTALAAIKAASVSTRLVWLTASHEPSEVAKAASMGAYGVISSQVSPNGLLSDLRKVMLGARLSPPLVPEGRNADLPVLRNGLTKTLTDREREIMQLVRAGLSNKEVGRQLNLSGGTIKVHLHHIYEKLAIHNRTALAALTIGGTEQLAGQSVPAGGDGGDCG